MHSNDQFSQGQDPIAIIGYAYRLPGVAEDKDEHVWDIFRNRKSVRVDIVEEAKRYDKGQVPWDGQQNPLKHASQWEGAFINDKDLAFDTQFFHTNANDAASIAVHHRLGLIAATEALENAGIDFASLCGSDTGVFAGGQISGSASFQPTFGPDEYLATGTALAMTANRISFFLNLTGPSVTYDTACSGLMTALHGAHASLHARECKLAILVAAVVHDGFVHNPSFAQLGVLSPTGRCHSFDDSADGYMPSDGAFCYILKRLSDAERDSNKIYGVIRGVHVSAAGPAEGHVGLTSGRSLTTPTVEGQKLALEGAYSKARINVDSVNYLECHATGTKVGDYVEASALGQVFGTHTRNTPLLLSSSRSNFGHMEAASAGLSILKVLLMFQHRTFLPLSDNFVTPNSNIPFEKMKLQPLSVCVPFPTEKVVIGINSFGFGGANGHAVIEEYVPSQPLLYSQPSKIDPSNYRTLVISAKSSKALYATAKFLLEVVQTLQKDSHDEQEILYHLAGNLAIHKTHYAVRKYFTVKSLMQLCNQLGEFIEPSARKEISPISENAQHRVCFIFPGQGSQWAGCGVSLYQTEEIFRNVVDTIDAYFFELSGKSLKEIMFSKPEGDANKEKDTVDSLQEELNRCDVAQPLNFMIQVGLVELCRNMGIHPACVVGHSAGELAAAYAAGATPLKEMVRVVYERARLQQQLSGTGRMLVVPLSPQELEEESKKSPQIFDGIEITCYNAPNATVVGGPEGNCEALSAHLKETRDLKCQFVRGNIPFHSSKMDSIKEDILHSLSFVDSVHSTPQIPVVSTVKAIVEGSFDKYYWWMNTRTAVKFEQAITYVLKHFRPTVFIELSPHITLRGYVRDIYAHLGASPATYVPTLIRNEDDSKMWANTIGTVFEKGLILDWRTLYPNPSHIKLPNYPFDYKITKNTMLDEGYYRRHGGLGAGPLLGRAKWTHDRTYETAISSRHFPFLAEHCAQNLPVMPAAGYIEMVLQALGGEPVKLKNVQFSAVCPVIATPRLLQLKFSSPEGPLDPVEFTFSSTSGRYDFSVPWTVHCSGVVQRIAPSGTGNKQDEKANEPENLTKLYDEKQFYDRIPEDAFYYGPGFRVIKEFSVDANNPTHARTIIKLDEKVFEATQKAGWVLHPYILDGVMQSYFGLCYGESGVPYSWDEFRFLRPPTSPYLRAEIRYPPNWNGVVAPGIACLGDARLYNEDGSLICTVRNNIVMVPPQAEGTNSIQGWQTKAINLPETQQLATEIAENQAEMDYGEITKDLTNQFRAAVLSFLGLDETAAQDTIWKKIGEQPSPQKEYTQILWGWCQQNHTLNSKVPRLLLAFAKSHRAAAPVPPWVFVPFLEPLKRLINTVISTDSRRVVRILEVSNSCNFSVLPHLQELTTTSLEYFFASASNEILTKITEQVQFDFPVRSLRADFDQSIPDEVMPHDGFFDIIIANMPTGLESQEKCSAFLKNYGKKVTPGGLLALTGFDKANDWLTCVGVDNKMVLTSAMVNTCSSQANLCQLVSTNLSQNFPHTIHLLKRDFGPIAQNSKASQNGTLSENGNLPQSQNGSENGNPSQNGNQVQDSITNSSPVTPTPIQTVVFADSRGFYDTISKMLSSPVYVPYNANQSFNIDNWLTGCGSLNILFLWSLQDNSEFCVTTFSALTELARTLIQAKNLGKVNVWVVTQNSVRETANMHSGAMWGLMRTIGMELGDMLNVRFYIVDVGTEEDMKSIPGLLEYNFCENECMIRNNEIFVSRVLPLCPESKDSNVNDKIINLNPAKEDSLAFRLQPARNAQLGSLAFHLFTLPDIPEPDQVIVRVHYAALNFRDLMVALDRLPHQSFEKSYLGKNLGIECSGIVMKVGANVHDFVPGEKVLCFVGGCIGNIVSVNKQYCIKVPEQISMPVAASVMSVYITAYYALIHMARLSSGMSCLVHSGMGGVGLATIALAKHYGFDVYATAGTEEKRTKLLEMGCKGVYDSHSFEWAEQLLHDTQGRGVDAVLNSLHGTHIELGLEVLAYGGWFCEIGKRDIYSNSKIGMYAMRKSITITAVDSDSFLKLHPHRSREVSTFLVNMIAEGKLAELPIEEYPACDYLAAFRQMQQGKHTGKLVISLRDDKPVPVVDHRPLFSPTATYLVTGGLGGFGLRLIPYLCANGARNLLLTDSDVSRRRSVEYVKQATQIGTDINIVIEYADVSKYSDIEKLVKECASKLPPLKGVFHLAGVLQGASIMAQNSALYEKVLLPKAHGALNLHKATQQHAPPLEHFVMVSSVASVLGSAGQASYTAANAFLDALVRHRRTSGLCGTTFNMGGILDVGMASKDLHIRRAIRGKGIHLYSSAAALAGLDYQLRKNIPEMVSANLQLDLKLANVWGYCTFGLLSKNNLSEAITMSYNAVLNLLVKQVQKLTGATDVSPTQPLSSFGVDSMMATEISIWLKDKFNVQISAIRLMSAESCESITQKVLSNHGNSSSASSSTSSSFSTPLQEENHLLGVETEFIDSTRINSQFSDIFTKTHIMFSSTMPPTVKDEKTADLESASTPALISNVPNEPVVKKEAIIESSNEEIAKDPKHVVQDIDDVCNSFAEYVETSRPKSPVHEFQNIFLTGATEFVGRTFLAHLIKHRPHVKVTCIVPAEPHIDAMESVKSTMQDAGCWQDSFTKNIIVLQGDLSQERFGQSEEVYNELCRNQHAVFHFPSNISLAEPYSSIRNNNTLVMLNILRLCATFTVKPLYYLSTLAVFPEYNAGFPTAWPEKVLREDDPIDLGRFSSPKELGYPWSKWACEQVALRCYKLVDIPVVIYRTPLTSLNPETGFMSDIYMPIAIAAMQEGILPAFGFLLNYSALDTICEVVVNLTFNNQRKHNVYHIVSKEAHPMRDLWRWMNETGFEVKYIAEEQGFIDTGSKPGSPLKPILHTLELMRSTNRNGQRPLDDLIFEKGLPISTRNTEEDYKNVKWPSAHLGYTEAFLRMLKQGDKCKYTLPKIQLQLESVLQHVQSFTGLSSMGPNSFYASLSPLFEALNAEAHLSDIGRILIRQDIWKRLLNRQQLFKAIRVAPEVLKIVIKRPIFILGLPGSGTTYLQRLLAEDPQLRAPYHFETSCPVLVQDAVGQAQKLQSEVEDVTLPSSDGAIMQHDIQCLSWTTSCDIPSFRSWIFSKADMRGSYAFHKVFLQFLQHQGRNFLSTEFSWVLEFPMHMMFAKYIFETYPDARIIQVHRPPAEVVSWWCDRIEKMRKVYSDEINKTEIGRSQLQALQEMLASIQMFRESHSELAARFIDVKYHDLVSSPNESIEKLYSQLFEKELKTPQPASIGKLQDGLAELERDFKEAPNLSEFGLSAEQVDGIFVKFSPL